MPSAAEQKVRRRKRRRRRRSGPRWFFWVIPLILILAAAGIWFSRTYILVGGKPYRKDTAFLDLRNETISVSAYENLRSALPEAEILWSVPLGGKTYDCTAETVILTSFQGGEESNLHYFRNLRFVDAVEAHLTPEQYEAICAALPGAEIRWSVPIGGMRYPSDSDSIALGDFAAEEIPLFRYFTALRAVDAQASQSYDALQALKETFPALDIQWMVPLSGRSYPLDAGELVVDDGVTSMYELERAMAMLPAVKTVSVPESAWSDEEKLYLAEQYPDVVFSWPLTLRGETVTTDKTELSFAGQSLTGADVQELTDKLRFFTSLERLDLTDCGLSNEEIFPLCDAYPAVDVTWTFDLYGVSVSTEDESIDLSNIPLTDTKELEAVLPYMHRLTKVDMCDCGISDEDMDALNQRYDPVRFVWMLHITTYKIRTDTAFFRATSSHYGTFTDETVQKLGYCEDMVVLDLGHRPIGNLEFVRKLQKLRFILLLDCRAQDLSPLADCPELIWVELNRASASSIAPLVGCTALRHLNITFMSLASQEDTFNTLMQMPWLERVWFSRPLLTEAQEQKLKEANPGWDLHVVYIWEQSNEDPWRYHELYYEMRDIMNMFYMNGRGPIEYKMIDGVRYELDPEFLANQDHGEHDRDHG